MSPPRNTPSPEPGVRERLCGPSRRRRTPADLLKALCDATGDPEAALLVVMLHRSDRLDALAQVPQALEAMSEVAARVESVLRPCDLYAVASVDELWIALTGTPARAVAELAARRVHGALSRPLETRHETGAGSASAVRLHPAIGVVHPSEHPAVSPRTLLARAHDAGRRAGNTPDRVVFGHSAATGPDLGVERRSAEIRAAIEGNDLEVFFQPQVALGDGRCTGAEALIRWPRTRPGRFHPGEIVAVAESDGLMLALTTYVLNNALHQLARWRQRGFDVNMSVNISAQSLVEPSLPWLIQHALETWDTPSSHLTLELTENLIVANEGSALEFMHELRSIGVEFSLDDFGTGYSSLAYLSRFPVNELKIDQSFVRPLGSASEDRRVIAAMLQLAGTFGLRTVAEGVESAQAAHMLARLGCDVAQGHHFGKPMPADEMTAWLRERAGRVGSTAGALG